MSEQNQPVSTPESNDNASVNLTVSVEMQRKIKEVLGYDFFQPELQVVTSVAMFPSTAGALGVIRPGIIAGRAMTQDRVTCLHDDRYAVVFAHGNPVGIIDLNSEDGKFVVTGLAGSEVTVLKASQRNPL